MKADTRLLAESTLAGWGVALDERQWALLDNYLGDVLEYNRKVNLTAASGEAEVVRRHFLDALAALPELRARLSPAPRLADIGAGAGFLGVCLKIAWPQAEITLIESAYRKFKFLSWAAARTGLRGLRVLHERAGSQRGFDCVLARAVAPLAKLAELALPMGKLLGAWESALPLALLEARDRAVEPCSLAARPDAGRIGGGALDGSIAYRLPGEDRDRHVVFIRGEEP
ncbi:MAG: 16S rRNA (guanine(527)-N(7))-methyltransferase RsmG [Elusimicrobia bacterium]|nr:16S rRNA (guanine(527)-N(7))-methyltransferase RsmG [Elusimicrobiota bacterium]